MRVLGIETSCDETAVAIVDGERRILAHRVRGQEREHRPYAGVVPEIAARAHVEWVDRLVRETLALAATDLRSLDGVAATVGPGLIGGLLVGAMTGKALALAHRLPFLAVNHLEGHALTARLTDDVAFPYLLLLVSGGHCQLLLVEGVGRYRRWGTTLDDAAGEAFDKVARMLGLGYPGGPAVERTAARGRAGRFALPRPFSGRAGCDFSFAGLKTAVRRVVEGLPEGPLDDRDVADLAADFQEAVADVVADRVGNALDRLAAEAPAARALVIAGGVAANRALRARLAGLAESRGVALVAPPLDLCTDNGAMIAWAGIERLRLGLVDGLDVAARPRWPLDASAPPASGAGVKA